MLTLLSALEPLCSHAQRKDMNRALRRVAVVTGFLMVFGLIQYGLFLKVQSNIHYHEEEELALRIMPGMSSRTAEGRHRLSTHELEKLELGRKTKIPSGMVRGEDATVSSDWKWLQRRNRVKLATPVPLSAGTEGDVIGVKDPRVPSLESQIEGVAPKDMGGGTISLSLSSNEAHGGGPENEKGKVDDASDKGAQNTERPVITERTRSITHGTDGMSNHEPDHSPSLSVKVKKVSTEFRGTAHNVTGSHREVHTARHVQPNRLSKLLNEQIHRSPPSTRMGGGDKLGDGASHSNHEQPIKPLMLNEAEVDPGRGAAQGNSASRGLSLPLPEGSKQAPLNTTPSYLPLAHLPSLTQRQQGIKALAEPELKRKPVIANSITGRSTKQWWNQEHGRAETVQPDDDYAEKLLVEYVQEMEVKENKMAKEAAPLKAYEYNVYDIGQDIDYTFDPGEVDEDFAMVQNDNGMKLVRRSYLEALGPEVFVENDTRPERLLTAFERGGGNIMLTLRTTLSYHSRRMPVIIDTWMSQINDTRVYIVTDGRDAGLMETAKRMGTLLLLCLDWKEVCLWRKQ